MGIHSNQLLLLILPFLAFTISVVIPAQAQDDSINQHKKEKMIDEIMKRVNRITQEVISKTNDKYAAIQEIEQKIRKVASSLGRDSEALVKILMQGVRANAFHGASNSFNSSTNVSTHIPTDATDNTTPKQDNTQHKTKKQLIDDIDAKIQLLAKEYFNNTNTLEENDKVLEIIKNKLLLSAKNKDILDKINASGWDSYVDLIMKGIKLAVYRIKTNDSRRMKIGFIDSNFKTSEENDFQVNILDDYSNVDEYITRIQTFIDFNQSYCEIVNKDLCAEIKSLSVLKCSQDNSEVSIEKLCNGVADCPDSTDELNCKTKAITRVHSARVILKKLEVPMISSCFSAFTSPSYLMSNEQNVLRQLLDRQVTFIKKYTKSTFSSSPFYDNNANIDKDAFRDTINEVVVVLQTFSTALNGFVCLKEELNMRQKSSPQLFVDELDDEVNQVPTWSPRLCTCNEQLCADEKCDNNCKRVCWQKYTLGQWTCQAVNGLTTVPIDVVCDGKLDCFDESDEIDCSQGGSLHRFDAINIYGDILNQVMERTLKYSIEVSTRNSFLALHTAVKKLQHICVKNNPDVNQVKLIRDQCFYSLKAVFEEIRSQASMVEEVDDANLFLSSINKMLVRALKYTHTGNDRLISPDGCYCRGTKCALPVCTRRCARACSVETVLTKYTCEGKDNVSVAVEYICNGKDNCPSGDDEQCQKTEICRVHHLVVLRHSIKDVDANQNGVLGEMIKAWKTKAIARLKIAENNGRPSPRVMKDIIHDLLRDLLMTYASIDDYRRSMALNHNVILDKFIDISRTVMAALKTCGK